MSKPPKSEKTKKKTKKGEVSKNEVQRENKGRKERIDRIKGGGKKGEYNDAIKNETVDDKGVDPIDEIGESNVLDDEKGGNGMDVCKNDETCNDDNNIDNSAHVDDNNNVENETDEKGLEDLDVEKYESKKHYVIGREEIDRYIDRFIKPSTNECQHSNLFTDQLHDWMSLNSEPCVYIYERANELKLDVRSSGEVAMDITRWTVNETDRRKDIIVSNENRPADINNGSNFKSYYNENNTASNDNNNGSDDDNNVSDNRVGGVNEKKTEHDVDFSDIIKSEKDDMNIDNATNIIGAENNVDVNTLNDNQRLDRTRRMRRSSDYGIKNCLLLIKTKLLQEEDDMYTSLMVTDVSVDPYLYIYSWTDQIILPLIHQQQKGINRNRNKNKGGNHKIDTRETKKVFKDSGEQQLDDTKTNIDDSRIADNAYVKEVCEGTGVDGVDDNIHGDKNNDIDEKDRRNSNDTTDKDHNKKNNDSGDEMIVDMDDHSNEVGNNNDIIADFYMLMSIINDKIIERFKQTSIYIPFFDDDSFESLMNTPVVFRSTQNIIRGWLNLIHLNVSNFEKKIVVDKHNTTNAIIAFWADEEKEMNRYGNKFVIMYLYVFSCVGIQACKQ